MRHKMPYAGKIMTIGVLLKAVVMGSLVTLLATTSFVQSIILVLVSATATGIFGLLIVLIQVHSERNIHDRLDKVENRVDEKAGEIKAQAQDIADKTDQIATVVSPEGK